ncbi:MAG: hypothetical protein IPL40_16055 [Proteobacteria bacterium]|nr:hypothetical protein [Pseudomonadota bacterium]
MKMLLSTRSPPQPLATALAIDATAASAADEPPPAGDAATAMDAGDDPHAGVPGAPPLGGTAGAATLSVAEGLALDRFEALALLGAARTPLAGAKVTLSRLGEPELTQPTDTQGRAFFRLPRATSASKDAAPATFTLQVMHDGHSYRSATLTPAQVGGKRATFVVYDRTTSRESLELAPGTHVLAQVSEGRLSCTHILVLVNRGPRLVDLGAGGLVVPLPTGALRAALSEETERVARLDERAAAIVLRGPLPPGQLVLQASYELPYDGATLEFRQHLPLGSARSLLALAEAPGVELSGPNLEMREVRRHQGVAMQLFSLSPVARGKQLELTLRNLPHRAEWPRQLVLGLTVLIALWATAGIIQGRRHAARRAAQRETLLNALAALERRQASGAIDASAYAAERAALIAQARLVWDTALPTTG